jgi:hypothetical protein
MVNPHQLADNMDILGFFDVEGVGESLSTDLH